MQKTSSAPSAQIDYLEKYIPVKLLAGWMVGLYVFLACVLSFVYFVYGTPHTYPDPELVLHRPMNQPTLQSQGARDLKVFLKEQNDQLSSYGWVSRPNGVVRIPIERAMELVVQKGFPSRGGKQP